MSEAMPTIAATNWIVAKLAGLPAMSGVKVFVAAADEATPRPRRNVHGPYVTLRFLGGQDVRYVGGRLAGSRLVIEASAWDEGTDVTRLQPIIQAVHGAIDRQHGLSDGIGILSCIRQAPVERQIREDDRLYTQLGGEYRIRTTTAP